MFDENKLPESKYIDGQDYDIDWDTYNGGKGLTPSQAELKRGYYSAKGYWCRTIKSEGRFMFYILAKDTPELWQKTRDYLDGKRKNPPNVSAEPAKKYRKPSTSSTKKRSSATKR
jgi:hypothetical protein